MMNTNNTEKKITGYPSIDKPWLKYYSEEAIKTSMPKCSVFDYVWEHNKEFRNNIALNYFGKKITYRELFENIDKTASAFLNMGVCEGDIVLGIAISTPEIIYSFYALNKIGAVSAWLDPRKSVDEIMNILKDIKPKVVMLLEDPRNELYELIMAFGAKIVSYCLKDSLPTVAKLAISLKNTTKNHNCIAYSDMIKKYVNVKNVSSTDFAPNATALVVYTGGTTGSSKGVMLSNENINSVAAQYIVSGVSLGRDHSWLSIGFPFIAYALIVSLHMPLSIGMTCFICFDVDVKTLEKTILKNKINHTTNTPVLWEKIIESDLSLKADYSFLINPTVGADSLDHNKEVEINGFLERHNCKYPIIKGYGMTEVSSAVAVNVSKTINKIGSVGIPFCATLISVFDPVTGEECKYDEQGEVCIAGPSVMVGYYNDKTATNEMLKRHSDDRLWVHSGDLGHIDSDGFLFIDGRLKRMIIDHNGFKIFAPAVESTIMNIPEVDKCCVVGSPDKIHQRGQVAIAFVIAKHGFNVQNLKESIVSICKEKLSSFSQPDSIIFVDQFPYTGASKVDYRELEKMAESQYNGE